MPLLVPVCPCHRIISWLPSQLGSSLWAEKSIRGRHCMNPPAPSPAEGTHRRTGSGTRVGSKGMSWESSRRLAANRTLPLKVGLGEMGGPCSLHPCVMGPVHQELAWEAPGRRRTSLYEALHARVRATLPEKGPGERHKRLDVPGGVDNDHSLEVLLEPGKDRDAPGLTVILARSLPPLPGMLTGSPCVLTADP